MTEEGIVLLLVPAGRANVMCTDPADDSTSE